MNTHSAIAVLAIVLLWNSSIPAQTYLQKRFAGSLRAEPRDVVPKCAHDGGGSDSALDGPKSLGESNAVFLSAWDGDVPRTRPKTGRARIRERNFPGRQGFEHGDRQFLVERLSVEAHFGDAAGSLSQFGESGVWVAGSRSHWRRPR